MKNINILKNNQIDVDSSLEYLGDMEMYDETLNEFLEAIDSNVEKIKTYKEKKDMENYAIVVHALKSDSKYLGFTTLAQLAFDHEMESKANNVDYINNHYEELIEEINRVIKVTKEYMNL